MTFHRWRKARPDLFNGAREMLSVRESPPRSPVPAEIRDIVRLDELRVENDRLRRLVANLPLEDVTLEEMLQSCSPADHRARQPLGSQQACMSRRNGPGSPIKRTDEKRNLRRDPR